MDCTTPPCSGNTHYNLLLLPLPPLSTRYNLLLTAYYSLLATCYYLLLAPCSRDKPHSLILLFTYYFLVTTYLLLAPCSRGKPRGRMCTRRVAPSWRAHGRRNRTSRTARTRAHPPTWIGLGLWLGLGLESGLGLGQRPGPGSGLGARHRVRVSCVVK